MLASGDETCPCTSRTFTPLYMPPMEPHSPWPRQRRSGPARIRGWLVVEVVLVQQRAHVAALVGRQVGPHVVRERHAGPRQPLGDVVQRKATLALAGIEPGQLDALSAAPRAHLFGAGDLAAAAAR